MTRNHDDHGPHGIDGDDLVDDGQFVVRREERLVASTERHTVGRVTVRKRIVTEERQITVTLRREEIDIIEEGIDASTAEPHTQASRLAGHGTLTADAAHADAPDAANELVLFAERPVVTTEWVPVERVRLDKRTVEGVETLTADVAREVVEVDDDRDHTGSDARHR